MPVPLLSLLLLLWSALPPSLAAETSTCLTVYREGGAPAVFRSPRCPRWTLFLDEDHGHGRRHGPVSNCQMATHQGRRRSQEDRAVCALDVRIPFIGNKGFKEEVSVGIVAVFDGHNGAEASEMASQLLVDYFFLHVYFLLDGVYSSAFRGSTERLTYKGDGGVLLQGVHLGVRQGQRNVDRGRFKWIFSKPFDGPLLIEILRESLLRAIHDIDATFSTSRRHLESGSTATIVLIVEGQILVANVGDSKAIMCSESLYPPHEFKGKESKFRRKRRHNDVERFNKDNEIFNLPKSVGPYLHAKVLTKDHHPDRDEERQRVEAAGGFVKDWAGVSRVNGELAVSRAIGDILYKRYGVISVPEVTDWLPLYSNDTYLVVASDGIFEKLTAQEVCDILWGVTVKVNTNSELISTITNALADLVVNAAFERGSIDNMAAIVMPLASTRNFPIKDDCDLDGSFHRISCVSNVMHTESDSDVVASSLISMEYFNRIEMKFNRLLVNASHRQVGCFYLAEDLNENMDYVFRAPEDHSKDEIYEIMQALPEGLGDNSSGWTLNLYTGQEFCWNFNIGNEKDKGECVNPEGFIKFLGLLSSIPLNDSGLHSSESFNYKNPDFRYVLKRKFDRGSYGEVWLAFQWNCSKESGSANHFPTNLTHSDLHLHSHEQKSGCTNSSSKHNFAETDDDDYFILKRIMVERGNTAYLSGLREKYFGELFLNASISLDRTAESRLSTTLSTLAQFDSSCLLGMNEPILQGAGNAASAINTFPSNFTFARVVYEEGLDHIARYVESFESKSKEIWLVFLNEGLSLSKLIYTVEEKKLSSNNNGNQEMTNVQVLYPSAWWHWLRTTEPGKKEMRNLVWQLLLALKSCHERNITHRDIKPENMIICFQDVDTGKCSRGVPRGENRYNINMRIIDFGSAIDEFTIKYLYGSGPSRSEQTFEYMSPEALLNVSWFQGPKSVTLKYDMWSVGVVFMELILGSPHVFQISDRTRALLDQHLEGWGDNMKELAYKLRSLMEMCILIPGVSPQHRPDGVKDHEQVSSQVGFPPASWKCTEEFFANQVKNRDPLKLGFPNIWALRLVRQLLVWHPEDRLSVDDALQHPYFQVDK